MSEAILVALIGLGGSAIGSLAGVLTSTHIMKYRIEELEKKVDKHNHLVERTFRLEGRVTEAEHDIRDLKRRHDD